MKTLRCDPKLFGKDLAGRTYLVTGANSGVGLETSRQLVRQGAHVVMACRRVESGEAAAASMAGERGSTEVMKLDLGSLDSVRQFAAAFLERHDRLDALVNNAGGASFSLEHTADGFEQMFGVNHLGHFLLTEQLLDVLKASAPSRIVILSSVVHAGKPGKRIAIQFDDLDYRRRPFRAMDAYGESKLANLLYAKELAERLQDTGVTAVSVHPGWVRSGFAGKGAIAFVQNVLLRPFSGTFGIMNNVDGAQTSLHCLLDDDVPDHSGKYFSQNSILYADKECRPGGWPMRSPNENAHDVEMARRLVEVSRLMVGLEARDGESVDQPARPV